MTVQELIALLQTFDPSLPVYDTDREGAGSYTDATAFLGLVKVESRQNICGEVTDIVQACDGDEGAFECVHVGV